jgi:2Fe-2S ferredoxin
MYTIDVSPDGSVPPKRLLGVEAGQTLLEIILLNNITLRHHCGGVCHCTTCHVLIRKGMEFIEEKSKRECDFLARVYNADTTSRLACQCLLLHGNGEMQVQIPPVASGLRTKPNQ